MKRNDFLAMAASLFGGGVWANQFAAKTQSPEERSPVIPPYLKTGDIIGITSPAGYIGFEELQPAIKVIESWGYRVKIGETIGKRDFSLGGTDEERAGDFQRMLDDQSISAILCARGGYGAVRIIDRLKWDRFREEPKWIAGFSDITVFHSHLNKNLGIASLHSKMCNSFPEDWKRADPVQVETILSIQKALSGSAMTYNVVPNASNRMGTSTGILIGGNSKTIESLSASGSDIDTNNKILFVEDTGEYMYSIDRMFWNLKRSGKLTGLKGLIVGGFKVKPDDAGEEFGRTLEQVVMEKVQRYHYPVCFDFPVGHQKHNFALKCGVKHTLRVEPSQCSLTEFA